MRVEIESDKLQNESEKLENENEGECYLNSTNQPATDDDDGEPVLRCWWRGFAIARWMPDASGEG